MVHFPQNAQLKDLILMRYLVDLSHRNWIKSKKKQVTSNKEIRIFNNQ